MSKSMDDLHTVGITRAPVEPLTLDAMIATTEQVLKMAPECWHHDLVTSRHFPQIEQGVWYMCIACHRTFLFPASLISVEDPPQRISIDMLRGRWEPKEQEHGE